MSTPTVAARLLDEIGEVVRGAEQAVDLPQIQEIGTLLGEFAADHDDLFGQGALQRLSADNVAAGRRVSLSRSRGYRHLGARRDPDLWLALFEFASREPTTIHDHATWGLIHGVGGRDRVRLYERLDDAPGGRARLTIVEEWVLERGDLAWWFDAPRNIHQQEALGDTSAYGLVLMGHDPTGSMQHQYDLETGRTVRVRYRG